MQTQLGTLNCFRWWPAFLFSIALTAVGLASAQTPLPDSFNPGIIGEVYAIAVQPDGKVLLGGSFTSLNGQPRTNLARLNGDGTLDSGFDPKPNGKINTLVVQADGRILAGGSFQEVAGRLCNNLVRLHPDGSFDSSFSGRVDGEVRAIGLQADGKIIVAGPFTTLDNEWCYGIGRLNADGSKDFGFSFENAGGADVRTVAVQADGRILMGGGFDAQIGGNWCIRIARWNTNGTLDLSFNPGNFSHNSASVDAIAVQADGKILVGGTFTNMADRICNRIGRVTAGGSFDSSFGSGANDRVTAFAIQADGKIIVAGSFTTMDGQPRSRLARFNADGTLDDSFNPGADGSVNALALQTDGKLIVSGSFTNLAGQPRTNLARLEATSPATRSLSRVGSDITWLRGGTSPEVWRTVFDGSTNGMDWTPLGAGNPTAGGWQLTNVLALANATIRARGFTTSGQGNNSGGVVKDSYGPPLLLVQPFSQTNNAGDVAGFEVRAIGSEPITLCWLKDGALLTNGSKFAGSETPALSVTNIQKSDEGGYSIVLSNSFGSVTSIVATLTVLDPGIATQPASQNREPGQETTFTVTPAGAAPFAFQWLKDGVALPDATNSALLLTNLLVSDAGHYTVVVSNSLGSITSAPAQLTVNGVAVDTGFDAGDGNNQVYAVVAQPDGKLLVGGGYTRIGGQPLNAFARLNADGSADTDFNPGFVGTTLSSIAYLPDRSMLLGGGFSSLGGAARHDIGRLTPDATADSSFTNSPTGWLSSLAVQADDTVFVGGYFTAFGGQPHTNLARLSADGSVDGSFNPAANDIAYAFVTLPDKRILVGGWFTMVNGQPRTNLARLNVDGSLDPTFTLDAASEEWSSLVFALTPQTDGKILVGGVFSTLGGMAHEYLARLNADGSLDDGFTAGVRHSNPWLRPSVNSIVVQCDGKILIGGVFTHVNGQPRANIARLNADGSLDLTFNPGGGVYYEQVIAIALQNDGDILAGGAFASFGGVARTNLVRLNNTGPAIESLSRDGSSVTWLRGGTGPEVLRTTFEHTGDGINWTQLGSGTRIPGGWQITGVNPPAGGTIRARGFLAAGYHNSSSGFVEKLLGAPVFTTQPIGRIIDAGGNVTFSLLTTGPEPLGFQWLKDGAPLADGAGVSGATTTTLALTGVLKAAEGDYRLVVTNTSGSVTSLVASLTVNDPVITMNPASRYSEPGQSVTFNVTAVGTDLNFHWWKDGVAISQTAASLVFTNVQVGDAGAYRVVVSNQFASVTSAVATLIVNAATLDTNFSPVANSIVSAIAMQPDGKTLVGGTFTSLAGYTRLRLGRLNTNGTLDTAFNPQPNTTVYSLAVQPDGKILVGGDFTTLAGSARKAIGRLNTNGTLDTNFNTTLFVPAPGYSITARVQAMLLLPDGKIVIGGRMTLTPPGLSAGFISRLHTNGLSDTSFVTTSGVNGPVTTLALQPDGKIVAGGLFTSLRGQPRNRLGRLNADGSLDPAFNPNPNAMVLTLAAQPDGKLLAGGYFTTIAGGSRTNLARLNIDGSLDTNFVANVTGSSSAGVYSLALQADGKVALGGFFTGVAGQPRANFARLNSDGSLDTGANPGPNGFVYGLAIQTDGRIVLGGDFTQLGGQLRSRIGRLTLPESATQNLAYNGSAISWQRGGSSPELVRATFEFSTNLANWTSLGDGARVAGGWELGGLSLLPAGSIRARGVVAGGGFNSSSWFAETRLAVDPKSAPVILTGDGSFGFINHQLGFNVAGLIGQTVVVEGSTDLTNWLPIRTNAMGDTWFHFSDSETNFPWRFYRARLE